MTILFIEANLDSLGMSKLNKNKDYKKKKKIY